MTVVWFGSVLSKFSLFGPFLADLPFHVLQKMLSYHPEVAQRKQRLQSRSVLGKTTVSNLHDAELVLHDSERLLKLRPNPGFNSLCCVTLLSRGHFQVHHQAPDRHHLDVPIHLKILRLFALL